MTAAYQLLTQAWPAMAFAVLLGVAVLAYTALLERKNR